MQFADSAGPDQPANLPDQGLRCLLTYMYVKQKMLGSDCTDVYADLGLHCLPMAYRPFSHVIIAHHMP